MQPPERSSGNSREGMKVAKAKLRGGSEDQNLLTARFPAANGRHKPHLKQRARSDGKEGVEQSFVCRSRDRDQNEPRYRDNYCDPD